MAHHGIDAQRGIGAMLKKEPTPAGRFGRLFPDLAPNFTNPNELRKLGQRQGPMDSQNVTRKAQTIPMGMVFFGQFIDHDITFDTTSRLDSVNDPMATQNFRTPSLDLDCIYGNGPEASDYLYRDKLYLLTGADGTLAPGQIAVHQQNDLMRNSQGTAIIGDPRNDENRIISQLQLTFIRFHNEVVDYLHAEDPTLEGAELFEKARETVTWHYQWIILHEFLPLMIGKPLVNQILGKGRRYYNPQRGFIPIEFSAAAYRFGHSLVPLKLRTKVNQPVEIDLFGPLLGIGFTPVSENQQIVEWEVFFDLPSLTPAQRTDQLDALMASALLELPFIAAGDENSLATRNLLRGQSFLLPSGEEVARQMERPQAEIDQIRSQVEATVGNIDLCNGTPLWYYILMEAGVIGRLEEEETTLPGEGLGPVGGTIVGETLVGLIDLDPNSFLSQNRNWVPTLKSDGTFTMGDLLTFRANQV